MLVESAKKQRNIVISIITSNMSVRSFSEPVFYLEAFATFVFYAPTYVEEELRASIYRVTFEIIVLLVLGFHFTAIALKRRSSKGKSVIIE